MKLRMKIAIVVAVLAVGAIPLGAYGQATYSEASIAGKWAWSMSGQLASRYKYAQIGIAEFDGKGKCTLTLFENSGVNGGYAHNSSACEYTVDKTGLGAIDYALDGEAGAAELIVGRGRISVMTPDEATVSLGELLPLAPATGKAAAGEYSYTMDGTIFGERITGVGTMSITPDGKCGQTVVYNYNTGPQRTKTESCTYTFGETGVADASIAYDNGTGGDLYFVVAKGGRIYTLTKIDGEIISGVGYRR